VLKKPRPTKGKKSNRVDPRGVTRGPKTRVKTARYRKTSSTRWLQRQLNDPYVAAAQRDGYRSRAAYKLLELNDRFHFLDNARTIVDLGAAPGGWSQVALQETNNRARIVGIDLLEVEPLGGAVFLKMDFLDDDAEQKLIDTLGGSADIVMSDMAATTTGHRQTDHLRTMALVETAFDFTCKVLSPGGTFIAKVLRGGTEDDLLRVMKAQFQHIRHYKPPASRPESTETYVIAQGFIGKKA